MCSWPGLPWVWFPAGFLNTVSITSTVCKNRFSCKLFLRRRGSLAGEPGRRAQGSRSRGPCGAALASRTKWRARRELALFRPAEGGKVLWPASRGSGRRAHDRVAPAGLPSPRAPNGGRARTRPFAALPDGNGARTCAHAFPPFGAQARHAQVHPAPATPARLTVAQGCLTVPECLTAPGCLTVPGCLTAPGLPHSARVASQWLRVASLWSRRCWRGRGLAHEAQSPAVWTTGLWQGDAVLCGGLGRRWACGVICWAGA